MQEVSSLDQGLMKLASDKDEGVPGEPQKIGLASSQDPNLFFNTTGALTKAAESAIPGLATQALYVAEAVMDRLDGKVNWAERPLPPQEPEGPKGREWASSDFVGTVAHRGADPDEVRQLSNRLEHEVQSLFPPPEYYLQSLLRQYQQDPSSLSSAQLATLKRSQQFNQELPAPKFVHDVRISGPAIAESEAKRAEAASLSRQAKTSHLLAQLGLGGFIASLASMAIGGALGSVPAVLAGGAANLGTLALTATSSLKRDEQEFFSENATFEADLAEARARAAQGPHF